MLWLDKINTHSTQPSLTLHLQLSHPFKLANQQGNAGAAYATARLMRKEANLKKEVIPL